MSRKKVYEIRCEWCKSAFYEWHGGTNIKNIKNIEREFIRDGGIINKKKHFCHKECFEAWKMG